MALILRPWANTDLDLTGAVVIAESALPQTLAGLAAGSYEIGRVNWNPAEIVVSAAATAPAAFGTGDWAVSAGAAQATLTISALPANGGSPITALQYRLDGGAPVTLSGTGTGARTITGLTNGTTYSVEVRAVNAIGAGVWSAAKNVTPVAAAATFNTSTTGPYFTAVADVPVTDAMTVAARLKLNTTGWTTGRRHLIDFASTSFIVSFNFNGEVGVGVEDNTGVSLRTPGTLTGVVAPTSDFFDLIVSVKQGTQALQITLNGVKTSLTLTSTANPSFQTIRRGTFFATGGTGANQLAAEVQYCRLWYSAEADGSVPAGAPNLVTDLAVQGTLAALNALTTPLQRFGAAAT